MKQIIRVLSLVLAAAMLLTSVGCLVKSDTDEKSSIASNETATVADSPARSTSESSDTPRDYDAVAVTLGDLTITAGDVENVYNSYIQMFSYYGMEAPTDDETIDEYVQMAIEALLADKVYEWKAKELGVTLTEDDLAEVDANAHYAADDEYTSLVLSYAEYYTDAGSVEAISDLTDEQLEETLNYLNWDVQEFYGDASADIDVYVSEAYENYYKMYLSEAYQNKLREKYDAELTEIDVDAWYEAELEDQKAELDSDPTIYRTYREDLALGYSTTPILYVPEGIAIVKVIAVSPDGEAPEEIAALEAELAQLEAEYGRLALNDGDEAELEQIRSDYGKQVAALNLLKDSHFGSAQQQAEALHARLDAGEDFDAVAASVNEAFTEEQVLYLTDTDYAFPDAVRNAAAALEDGAYTAVVQDGDTYYIVKLVGRLTPGAVDREPIADEIYAVARESAQNQAWNDLVLAWEDEAFASAVYNKEAYAFVGR